QTQPPPPAAPPRRSLLPHAIAAAKHPLAPQTAVAGLRPLLPHCDAWKKVSLHQPQGPPPACLIKEMDYYVGDESDPAPKRSPGVLVARSFKGPVNKHGPPDDVFPRNKAPVAAIQAYTAMI